MKDTLQDFLVLYDLSGYDEETKAKLYTDAAQYYETVVAVNWYKKAADFRSKLALRKLANYYKTKLGKEDPTREKYLQLAYDYGDSITKKMVLEIFESEKVNQTEDVEPASFEETPEIAELDPKSEKEIRKSFKEKEQEADKLYKGDNVKRDIDKAIVLYKEVFDSQYRNRRVCKVLSDHYFDQSSKKMVSAKAEDRDLFLEYLKLALQYSKAYSVYGMTEKGMSKSTLVRILDCFTIAMDKFGIKVNGDRTCSLLGEEEKYIIEVCIQGQDKKISKADIIFEAIQIIHDYYEKLDNVDKEKTRFDDVHNLIYSLNLLDGKTVIETKTGKEATISKYGKGKITILIDGEKVEKVYPDVITKLKLLAFKDSDIQDKFMSYDSAHNAYNLAVKALRAIEVKYNRLNVVK